MTENDELLTVLKNGFEGLRDGFEGLKIGFNSLHNGFVELKAELHTTRVELSARIAETNARLDQTNAMLDQTNVKLGQAIERVEQVNINVVGFQMEMRETLGGLSTFLISSERSYRALESRVFNLEQWRKQTEHRDDAS